ncbi:MAG: ABC transporter permease [Desulfobacter sp.]|nr:ABC transporter permease [Desulfobacter sp.]WDP88146.1 MAG: ABC transporter permease [Desulfobacter sp.]
MAWRNIWRNPRRTLLTVMAIAFASLLLVFMLSLQVGMYEVMINAGVKTHTGHIQVTAADYNKDPKIRKTVADPKAVAKIMDNTDHVSAYTLRANGFALLSSSHRTYGGMVTGIDPGKEPEIFSTAATIRQGKYLSPQDRDMAVVGTLLAKNLKIGVNDEIVILGSALDGSIAAAVLRVKGTFSSGMDTYDRSAIQIPLAYFQDIFAMAGQVHQVVAVCDSLWSVGKVKKTISDQLPFSGSRQDLICQTWDEIMPGLIQSIQMDLGGGIIFYSILIVVVAFSIMNTFLMSVFERTQEFGTLLAIGARPGRLTKMLLIESGFLTLWGILLGIAAGASLTLWAESHGISFGQAQDMLRQYGIPSLIRPKLSLGTALAGPFVVFIITMLTAVYPAIKVHKLNPVEAMHSA